MVVETRHSQGSSIGSLPKVKLNVSHPAPIVTEHHRYPTRRSQNSAHEKSGSEYTGGDDDGSGDGDGLGGEGFGDEEDAEGEMVVDDEEEPKVYATKGGRVTRQKSTYIESSEDGDEDELALRGPQQPARNTRRKGIVPSSDEEDATQESRYPKRNLRSRSGDNSSAGSQRSKSSGPSAKEQQAAARSKRLQKRANQREQMENASFEIDHEVEVEEEAELSAAPTASSDRPTNKPTRKPQRPPSPVGYTFRKRAKVNYVIPPPLEQDSALLNNMNGKNNGRNGGGPSRPKPKKGLGWNMSGRELSKYVPLPGDDSDSDAPGRSPRKRPGIFPGAGAPGASGSLFPLGAGGDPAGNAAGGGPSNFGRITAATTAQLADTDPLGINPNVNFSSVGGLASHIASLREMTLLPLLYPEVFLRFGVTPPRGVLFHGPPGTGKTLMARALASSCRTEGGRQVAFFMRKGADCLSKWVGEAERQLRLLFEEARASQPSIIFFDEIDGLAPVRSSKQDQIHASIVSTLLALMDGMDGRGQVVVIGATNRPDAVDPALRRPGRFDREFYFPLPSLEAREEILKIHTSSWEGWDADGSGTAMRKQLAKMTKGYGGADLRALCTEASLNAVKRCYPQIYRSEDRLLIDPMKIKVEARDFMSCIKKLVPSSARSSASTATPLPTQLVPLLSPILEHIKTVLGKIIPPNSKTRDLLEEAEYEDAGGGLEQEMMLQNMETLRVYRPRMLLCGASGIKVGSFSDGGKGRGVGYVGAAVLDWLEGYHVQSLDLGSLLSDSTRSPEAAIVQLFVEAKRNQPSVIYIPSLNGWASAVSETARTTVSAMLDTLAPTDPILLLAIVDGTFLSLPKDVRNWFGLARSSANKIDFTPFAPTTSQRDEFFRDLLENVKRKPSEFPDGWKRKKRVLEVLPIAPPLQPKPPSEAELAAQLENDMRTMSVLKYRLGPVLNDLKRKFKVFTKKAHEEYGFNPETCHFEDPQLFYPNDTVLPNLGPMNGDIEPVPIVEDDAPIEFQEPSPVQEDHQQQQQEQMQIQADPPVEQPPKIKMHNMDLEKMHVELYREKYLTLDDFLRDIEKIVDNAYLADQAGYRDNERLFKANALKTAAEVHYHDFDPAFRTECERMAVRERQRREEERSKEEKEREKLQPAVAIRRSNRANGLAPELGITDVAKLERSLKRQRSSEVSTPVAGGGASGSDDDSRDAKRSRTGEGQQNADGAGNDDDIQVLPNGQAIEGTILAPNTPTPPHPMLPNELPPSAPSGMMSVSSLLNTTNHSPIEGAANAYMNPVHYPSQFATSSSPFSSELGQTATFPMGPSNPHIPPITYPAPGAPGMQMPMGPAPTTTPLPTPGLPLPPPTHNGMGHLLNPFPTSLPLPPPPTLPLNSIPEPIAPQPQQPSMEVDGAIPQPVQGAPDIIERPATPRPPTPPPPFILPDDDFTQLQTEITEVTAPLNVEELEQLRATALDAVYRSRTNWDRTDLVKELRQLVREFVEDATATIGDEFEDNMLS